MLPRGCHGDDRRGRWGVDLAAADPGTEDPIFGDLDDEDRVGADLFPVLRCVGVGRRVSGRQPICQN